MPVQIVRLKNHKLNIYLIAGDLYNGHVYMQNHEDRLNSIWAMITIPGTSSTYEFRDMKHGFKLVNGEDFSPPDGKTVDVAHMDAGDQDKRLKWQVNAVLPMTGV